MKLFALRFIGIVLLALIAVTPAVHAAALPISVVQDDRAAVLAWDGGENANIPMPANVTGYRVVWGETTNPTANSALTAHRVFEAQPLTNGTPYIATITAIDSTGASLDTLPPIFFTGDSGRITTLRQTLSGFFDDFNLPMGAPDETKWNMAFSGCNGPQSGFFINAQFHVHTMTAATKCDRGQTVVRPRATFDFTNRTGSIAFDFDGEQRRDQFYLDFTPSLKDITGQVAIEAIGTTFAPGTMLRIHQTQETLEIIQIDSFGIEHSLASTDWHPYKPLDWAGVGLVPNVRRHWLIQISQTKINITIDGIAALSAPVTLPFSRATVTWNEFSYNTPKSNEPYVTSHWDNFGFDGPAATTETHNYRSDTYDTTIRSDPKGVSYPVAIPDSLTGAIGVRLMYTLQQPSNTFYRYSPADSVTVNGKAFPMPRPVGPSSDLTNIVSTINPYSQIIQLPLSLVMQGANSVTVACAVCGTLNLHIELDFPIGKAPAYTQPMAIMPPMVAPPPGAAITAINGTGIAFSGTAAQNSTAQGVAGAFSLDVEATQEIAMGAVGKNPGIAGVELRLDKQTLWNAATTDSPRYTHTLLFNDAANPASLYVANGTHELYFVAYDDQGRASYPDYFQADAQPGDYYPIVLNVSGAPSAPSPTLPTVTALPPTPVPANSTPAPAHVGGVANAGVNLASACFTNAANLPGTYGTTYVYPTHAEVDYAASKGENVLRLCFQMENLMGAAGANFDPTEEGRLDDLVNYTTAKGIQIIIDPHNFGRYFNKVIGQDVPVGVFADFWTKLAARYKDNPLVIFELMNEPNSEASETWWGAAQAATNAIRATGATNLILVPGNGWDGADSWTFNWYGTPNGTLASAFVDPGNHYAFEAHEYMDGAGGTLDTCTSVTAGSGGLQNFVLWLKANGKKGWITEFGAGRNPTCSAALDDMLRYMDSNSAVISGWTWWAAGSWWGDWETGGYRYSVEPSATDGKDAPQMAYLQQHFPLGNVPVSAPTATATLAVTATDTPPTATVTPPTTTKPIGVMICFKATGQCSYWPGVQLQDVTVESYP